jgi:hypothetical protein
LSFAPQWRTSRYLLRVISTAHNSTVKLPNRRTTDRMGI